MQRARATAQMAAAKPADDSDLLYRFRAAHKKRDGWCRITARGIEWQSDRENKALDVPYAELASHEVSPEDHPKALVTLESQRGQGSGVDDPGSDTGSGLCDAV